MARTDVVVREIDRFVSGRDSADTHFTFVFMGGEPLLNFDVFMDAVEFISSRPMMAHFDIRLVTNGLLINDCIAQWLNRHDNISVAISTDDVSLLANSNVVNVYAKTVIYPSLLEGEKALLCICGFGESNYYDECVCADGADWQLGLHEDLLRRMFSDLTHRFVNNPAWTPPNLLCAALWQFGDDVKICNPGVNAFCIDPDGQWYDCNRETPIYNNGGFRLNYSLNNPPDLRRDECPHCPLRALCAICPAVKASIQNESQAQIKCLFVKESIRASLEYQSRIAIAVNGGDGDVKGYRFFEDRPWLDYKTVSKGCVDVARQIGVL